MCFLGWHFSIFILRSRLRSRICQELRMPGLDWRDLPGKMRANEADQWVEGIRNGWEALQTAVGGVFIGPRERLRKGGPTVPLRRSRAHRRDWACFRLNLERGSSVEAWRANAAVEKPPPAC